MPNVPKIAGTGAGTRARGRRRSARRVAALALAAASSLATLAPRAEAGVISDWFAAKVAPNPDTVRPQDDTSTNGRLMSRWMTKERTPFSSGSMGKTSVLLGDKGWESTKQVADPQSEAEFGLAKKEYDAKRFDKAEALLRPLAKREVKKGTAWGEKAQYFLAEAQFQQKRYTAASDSYETLIQKYPGTEYIERLVAREYQIAQIWLADEDPKAKPLPLAAKFDGRAPFLDSHGYAIKNLEHVRLHDPQGPLADDAALRTADHYHNVGDFETAAVFYDQLLVEHPKSPYRERAQLSSIDAKMKGYIGPEYDSSGLEAARETIKRTMAEFPEHAAGAEQLYHTLDLIDDQAAEREYTTGLYYARARKPISAEYQFGLVHGQVAQEQVGQAGQGRDGQGRQGPEQGQRAQQDHDPARLDRCQRDRRPGRPGRPRRPGRRRRRPRRWPGWPGRRGGEAGGLGLALLSERPLSDRHGGGSDHAKRPPARSQKTDPAGCPARRLGLAPGDPRARLQRDRPQVHGLQHSAPVRHQDPDGLRPGLQVGHVPPRRQPLPHRAGHARRSSGGPRTRSWAAPEDADTTLEGTITFAEKNVVVENPNNLPRQFTSTLVIAVTWTDNKAEEKKNPNPAMVADTFNFYPEIGETAEAAFYRTCREDVRPDRQYDGRVVVIAEPRRWPDPDGWPGRSVRSWKAPRPRVMGILNVTPDSFSDGGRADTLARAALRPGRTAGQAEGADLLDIGGESSRPGAIEPSPVDEEIARVVPVVEALARRLAIPISVDTTKLEVARLALEAGRGDHQRHPGARRPRAGRPGRRTGVRA